jgi:hypothetical protein
MKTPPIKVALAVTALAGLGLTGGVTAASAATHPAAATPVGTTVTATTSVTDHPDSGTQGDNWANDNFTRVATVTRLSGTVAVGLCPGSGTGFCYKWSGTITDSGHFTTVAGVDSPRTVTLLDQSLTGTFNGGSKTIQFYSSWKTANAALVVKSVDGTVSGRETSTDWVEQFFGATATFGSAANPGDVDLGNWSWKYTMNFGSNSACPNDAYQWIDSLSNGGGGQQGDGNILTPNAKDCT